MTQVSSRIHRNLSSLISQFLIDVCGGKTNETPMAYLGKLRYLERFLEEQQEQEITQEVIERFRIWLFTRETKIVGKKEVKGKLSPFTIKTVLTTVRHFLRWANEHGHLPKIILKNIKEPQPDPKAVSPNTFECMLEAALTTGEEWEKARNVALLYLLRDTGGRCGSIVNLRLDNIDLDRGSAVVLDKGGRYSWLFFTGKTIEAIQKWLEYRDTVTPKDVFLLLNSKGMPLNRQYIRRVLNELAKIGGVDKERHNPHSFRHAFARDLLLAGADLSQASQLLNHSTIVTTARYYARWSKKELAEIHHKYSPLNHQ
ncbi:MAG: Integrase [Anaerolineae bacterium]|nr:MAG: Integrase [Anaerolineae bacterium]